MACWSFIISNLQASPRAVCRAPIIKGFLESCENAPIKYVFYATPSQG